MVTLNSCQRLNGVASSIPHSVACYFFMTAEAIACLMDIQLNLISFKVNHFFALLCFQKDFCIFLLILETITSVSVNGVQNPLR